MLTLGLVPFLKSLNLIKTLKFVLQPLKGLKNIIVESCDF